MLGDSLWTDLEFIVDRGCWKLVIASKHLQNAASCWISECGKYITRHTKMIRELIINQALNKVKA